MSDWILSEQIEQLFVKVIVPIVEAPFAFLEVKVKRMIWHTVELLQSSFGKAPKALNPVDMTAARCKLIGAVIDAKVFGIADINQAVIAAPSVAVNRHFGCDTAPDDGLQRGFAAVGHDLGVNATVALEQPEDGRFARCAATAFAAHATWAKIAFIDFDFARYKR